MEVLRVGAMGEKVLVLLAGKRKSGKDWVAGRLEKLIAPHASVAVTGISHSLKQEFAKGRGLNYSELLGTGEYKERYRLEMIKWGEEMRSRDAGYFCRKALAAAGEAEVVIVADCRRESDLEWLETASPRVLAVRVSADESTRKSRGYRFVEGIDDAQSECGLDRWSRWDWRIDNSDGRGGEIERQFSHLVQLILSSSQPSPLSS